MDQPLYFEFSFLCLCLRHSNDLGWMNVNMGLKDLLLKTDGRRVLEDPPDPQS